MADFGIGVPDEIARLSLGNPGDLPPLPAPPQNSAGVIPVDITTKFRSACKTLEDGQLIKDGFFTLFESVSALEIMDPKMDSGCVAAGEEFEELYDVSRPLLPNEVLGIIDELLCHEMSWHMGYPLSQTLLTNVYVEALSMPDPANINEATFIRGPNAKHASITMLEVLRAYCLGLLKACGYVNMRVKSEHYYEEEDFVTNTYNRTLLSRIATADIRTAIDQAREQLLVEKESIGAELVEALLARLDLRKIFLDAAESPQHVKNVELARAPWLAALPVLPIINRSHELAKPVDEAFSTKLQRKLASTMPPRAIVKLEFDPAFDHLSRLFHDGAQLIDVLNYHDSQSLLTFVRNFQSKKPQPLVYIRTLLQTFFFDSMEVLGSMSIRQLLDDDLSTIALPASPLLDRLNDEIEAVHDVRFIMAQQMELFRQRAAQPFLDIFRTLCQNRSRTRRTLCHVIRDWDNLQFDAEDLDQYLQDTTDEQPLLQPGRMTSHGAPIRLYSLSLSSWAFLYKVRMMEEIVQLGFELEVYQPDELAGMYWYLNYLAKSRLHHTERIKSFIVKRVQDARSQPGKMEAPLETELHRSLSFIRLSLLDAAVTWELSDALASLYAVLNRLHLIKSVQRPYSTDTFRYELRMKPFASISLPPLPTFEHFTEGSTQPDVSTEILLEHASRAVLGAKKGLEAMAKLSAEDSFSVGSHDSWTANAKSTLKSCISTSLAITNIQAALSKRSYEADGLSIRAEVPTPDKAYHHWWLVPKIGLI